MPARLLKKWFSFIIVVYCVCFTNIIHLILVRPFNQWNFALTMTRKPDPTTLLQISLRIWWLQRQRRRGYFKSSVSKEKEIWYFLLKSAMDFFKLKLWLFKKQPNKLKGARSRIIILYRDQCEIMGTESLLSKNIFSFGNIAELLANPSSGNWKDRM